MNPIKIEKTQIDNYQVYFADYLGEFIIVNNDYMGLLFLNQKLEKVGSVDIFHDFVIEKTYFNLEHNTALFLCREQNCFVIVNKQLEIKIIDLNEDSSDLVFSDLYYWSEKEILLSTYSDAIYSICLQDNKFEKLTDNYVRIEYPYFYDTLKLTNVLTIGYYDMKNGVFSKEKGLLINYSHSGKIKLNIKLSDPNFEISAFNKWNYLIFNEYSAEIHYNEQEHVLSVDRPYMFRAVRFLSEEKLLVLLTNKSDPFENLLRIYKLPPTNRFGWMSKDGPLLMT